MTLYGTTEYFLFPSRISHHQHSHHPDSTALFSGLGPVCQPPSCNNRKHCITFPLSPHTHTHISLVIPNKRVPVCNSLPSDSMIALDVWYLRRASNRTSCCFVVQHVVLLYCICQRLCGGTNTEKSLYLLTVHFEGSLGTFALIIF